MKHRPSKLLALLVLVLAIFSVAAVARAQTSAQDRADSLRLQLEEIKTKQLDLQTRLQILDEQMQPENIEKSLAGTGSTRPEDLRELRRKQLEKEKQGTQQQLALLATSQTRLETAIARADAYAYHQSAQGPTIDALDNLSTFSVSSSTTNTNETVRPRRTHRRARHSTHGMNRSTPPQ